MRDAMRDVTEPSERLTIVQTDSMVLITGADGRTTRLSADGKKIKDENTGVERKTKWDGGKLVSEISGLGPREDDADLRRGSREPPAARLGADGRRPIARAAHDHSRLRQGVVAQARATRGPAAGSLRNHDAQLVRRAARAADVFRADARVVGGWRDA